jgi:putative ABC transport system ATP-binding protein
MDPHLSLRQVGKTFNTGGVATTALRRVDFSAQPGELTFLIGPSGCGKTTLLSVLCGTLAADEGEIHVLGHDLRALSPRRVTEFRARHVGFIFQQFNLIPALTAEENVGVPLRIRGVGASEANRRARELLGRVGMADKAGTRPSRLSGGQQQRVAIARALIHEPDLVVCDEPTSALDSRTGKQVMDLLRDVARDSRRSVIVVTHDPRTYAYADRMVEMEDGRIVRRLESPAEIAAAHPPTPRFKSHDTSPQNLPLARPPRRRRPHPARPPHHRPTRDARPARARPRQTRRHRHRRLGHRGGIR